MEKKKAFPADFTENDNVIEFVNHKVNYEFIGDVYETYEDEDGEEQEELIGYEHEIIVEHNETIITERYFQGADDSCKWTFWETYERICKRLNIEPVGFDD
jgi:hypothetical protein